MKILIYTGTYKKNHDGVARSLYHLVDTLLQGGHQVMVVSPQITPQSRPNLNLCQSLSVPVFFYPDYRMSIPSLGVFAKVARFRPDIIHISTPDFIGFLLSFYARIRRVPHVFIHHSDAIAVFKYYHMGFLQNPMVKMFKRYYNKAAQIYVPTQEIKNTLLSYGVKSVSIWSRGVDRERFNEEYRDDTLRREWGAAGKKVVLYAGRLVWYKGLQTYAAVYNRFQARGKDDCLFVLAGGGPIEAELREMMPHAVFLGALHDRDLSEAYASSDILLFPSTTETFGQVVQEALASGLPAVVSDIGGCQEIVTSSGAGFVAQANDTSDFFVKCLRLIEDPEIYTDFRAKALKFTRHRSWDHINRPLIRAYAHIAKRGRIPRK